MYRAGFATVQANYDKAVREVFTGLDRVEEILSRQRYLTGSSLTEADVRLYTSLVRFDRIYVGMFKVSLYCGTTTGQERMCNIKWSEFATKKNLPYCKVALLHSCITMWLWLLAVVIGLKLVMQSCSNLQAITCNGNAAWWCIWLFFSEQPILIIKVMDTVTIVTFYCMLIVNLFMNLKD